MLLDTIGLAIVVGIGAGYILSGARSSGLQKIYSATKDKLTKGNNSAPCLDIRKQEAITSLDGVATPTLQHEMYGKQYMLYFDMPSYNKYMTDHVYQMELNIEFMRFLKRHGNIRHRISGYNLTTYDFSDDMKEIFHQCISFSMRGHPHALYLISDFYLFGVGVTEDMNTAFAYGHFALSVLMCGEPEIINKTFVPDMSNNGGKNA